MKIRADRRLVLVALSVLALLMVSSCQRLGSHEDLGTPPPIVDPLPTISAADQHDRGTIVESSPLSGSTSALDAAAADSVASWSRRIVYRSVSGLTGGGVEVSGAFFVPRGPVPPGGWNVVAFGHGTTGITPECGPSAHPDLLGYDKVVSGFLKQGYAVALTDYQGLGAGPPHPYLEPRSAAFNIIDAVRAIGAAVPQVSTRWIAVGIDQGGQATWAVDELNGFYGAGLDYVGSVALAPVTNLADEPERAYLRTLTTAQLGFWPMMMTGLQNQGVAVKDSTVVTAAAHADIGQLTGCDTRSRAVDMSRLSAADVGPSTESEMVSVQRAFRRNALPQYPLTAPLLVESGSADPRVPPSTTADAVRRSCDMGSPRLQHVVLSGKGHDDIVLDNTAVTWIDARFAGKPAPTTCGSQQ